MQAVYAFHFLTPYPKMMWQFGELGYDFSINMNEDGQMGVNDEYRTHRKPIRWDYANDANRKAVYDAISKVLEFRNDNEEYYAQDNLSVHTWSVGDTNLGGKILVMDRVIMVETSPLVKFATMITRSITKILPPMLVSPTLHVCTERLSCA